MTAHEKSLEREKNSRRYNFLRIWNKRYAHMLARHDGRSTHYSHCQGKGIMPAEEFYAWCMEFENLEAFLSIYFEWAQNDFSKWWSPSVDRIDPELGYVAGNIQWLSYAENSEKNHKDPMVYEQWRNR